MPVTWNYIKPIKLSNNFAFFIVSLWSSDLKFTKPKLWCCQQQSVGSNPGHDTCAHEQGT